MVIKEYLEQSARTAAGDVHRDDEYPLDRTLLSELTGLAYQASGADVLKRHLFYKDDMFKRVDKHAEEFETLFKKVNEFKENGKIDQIEGFYDVMHAALGQMSEASEVLVSIINSALEGKPLDVKNLREEAGDNMWYTALLLRAIKSDFEEAGEININKLKVRFPDKFDSDKAINRDLDKEEETL